MSAPYISILLPTFNSVRYLRERIESILEQSVTDWELIVVDSYSNDGTWELLSAYAKNDQRFKLFQQKKLGIYPAINFAIHKSSGKYIYIATSDDTMHHDCLKIMCSELELHKFCDICHCKLEVIDENGQTISNWWQERPVSKFYGELDNIRHIRLAPLDGLLHIALYIIYGSLTQIVIRRSALDLIGMFKSDWGPRGDFEWGMRAGSLCNTIHIPDTLATWRIHSEQATTPSRGKLLIEMVYTALPTFKSHKSGSISDVKLHKLIKFYKQLELLQELQNKGGLIDRSLLFFKLCVRSPYNSLSLLIAQIRGVNIRKGDANVAYMRKIANKYKLLDNYIIVP